MAEKQTGNSKSKRNRQVFIAPWNMVYLLVWAHFSLIFLTGRSQKEPLFDLESPTRYSADFCLPIHETTVVFIHQFWH